jgi:hypothetical protein
MCSEYNNGERIVLGLMKLTFYGKRYSIYKQVCCKFSILVMICTMKKRHGDNNKHSIKRLAM